MAKSLNGDGIEQPKLSNENGVKGTKSASEQNQKGLLAHEDKWTGWDGPVWCSRYGRFENQEDASADDGYSIKGQPPHQDLELERCEKHGCSCKIPIQHRSYVQDIQRRVEPMVASLVRLEHQVGKLVHHVMLKEGGASAHDTNGNGNTNVNSGFADRYDDTTHVDHALDQPSHTDHGQHSTEPTAGRFQKLEARVESLKHQLHQFMINEGHHFTEKEPEYYQGGR